MASPKKPAAKARKEPHQTGIVLYEADTKQINSAMSMGLAHDVRLSMGQTIRMLIRLADITKLKAADFEKALQDDDGRRRPPE